MVSVTLLSVMVLGTTTFFFQRSENMRAKQAGNDMALVLNAIDKKLQMDAYSTSSWKSQSWTTTNDFLKKLIAEELRTSNSNCGQPGGWVSEYASDPLALIPCDRLKGDILPFNLQAKAEYIAEPAAKGTGTSVAMFTVDYYFKDDKTFKENFGSLNKAQKALDKFETAKNLTVHSYNWIDMSSKQAISLENCMQIDSRCGLRTQVEVFSGISTDKVRIDGKNDLMGEIDFDNADTKCTKWTYSAGTWSPTEIKCTVKGGFDSEIGSVEAFINNTTIAERVSLKDQCDIYDDKTQVQAENNVTESWLDTTNKVTVPCGLNKSGVIITSGFEKTNGDITLAEATITNNAKLSSPIIKEDANFYGDLKTNNAKIEKSLTATNTTVSGNTTSILTDVLSAATNNQVKNSVVGQMLLTHTVNADTANLNIAKATDSNLGIVNTGLDTKDSSGNVISRHEGTVFVDTRDPKYTGANGAAAKRTIGTITGNAESATNFYSGYSTTTTVPNNLADQAWNTLKINNISNTSFQPEITGSTKNEDVLKLEMGKPTASALELAIYKDSKTFYSDKGSSLTASSLTSDGALFTSDAKATTTPKVDPSSVFAESGYSDEPTTVNGAIVVRNNGVNRVVVDTTGTMAIYGKNTGGNNTSADFMLAWPASAEGSLWENGFRNKVFRSSLVSIINGTTVFYGDVVQWKPLHMNSKYSGTDVCDRPNGFATDCLVTGWNQLNQTESILQRVQAQYDLLQKKFPIKQGDDGDKGEQGFKGAKGQTGDVGAIGVRGPQGPMAYLIVN